MEASAKANEAVRGFHEGQPVLFAGEPISQARAAVIMLHGRGGQAADILAVARHLTRPGFAFVAPEAAGHVWYPQPYSAPLAANEPWLSSALFAVGSLACEIQKAGIPTERTMLLGFSQGACLALEFVARRPRLYGGVVALSGALIGPPDTPRNVSGSLEGTPIFLGCGDRDEYLSAETISRTGDALRRLGGNVAARLYPRLGHIIHPEELNSVRQMMAALVVPA